jgi:hypothetical protein
MHANLRHNIPSRLYPLSLLYFPICLLLLFQSVPVVCGRGLLPASAHVMPVELDKEIEFVVDARPSINLSLRSVLAIS